VSFVLGYTTSPSTSAYETGLNFRNQNAVSVTAPAGGAQIVSISAYFGGWNSAITAAMCIWEVTAGNLLTTSAYFTAPGYPLAVGAQGWQTMPIGPFNLTAGNAIYIGWWRAPSQSMVWSENSGFANEILSTNTSGAPGNWSGTQVAGVGIPGLYCTCNALGGLPWWNGSAWQKSKCMSWNGSAWIWNPGYFWNGSFWQHSF
jgi:hypothetical protein